MKDKTWDKFDEVLKSFQSGFSDMSDAEIDELVESELNAVRKEKAGLTN